MSTKISTIILSVVMGGIAGMSSSANAYTLNEYIDAVKKESLGYQAFSEAAEAATLKSRDADLFFTPKFFANVQTVSDGKPQFGSAISYDRIKMENYAMGISQEFDFGLKTTLSYSADKTSVENAVGDGLSPGTSMSFWFATPKLELSLPLWGNAFGSKARADRDLAKQQQMAEKFGSEAQAKGFLAEAEVAYWNLSSAQDVVAVQKRAQTQAQAIFDYVARKEKMNLGERADVLQARAMVEAVTYQLLLATNQEKSARRQFNTYLNKPAEAAAPALKGIDYGSLLSFTAPQSRPGDRYDIQAALSQVELAKASAKTLEEKNRPTLDLYGSYSLNGMDTEHADALSNAGYTEKDTTVVGVRLNIPLNVGAALDTKKGAMRAARAAELSYQHKKFTQDQDWENLVQRLSEAKEGLRLANGIVDAQKAKLDNERVRLRQGRTTTYQVLLFEQDFSQAEVSRVQAAAQILGLQAQIKLYETNAEGGK